MTQMPDTSDEYIDKALTVGVMASDSLDCHQLRNLIRALRDERNYLKEEIEGLHELAADEDI